MSDIDILKKIAEDVSILREKVERIEIVMNEIDQDLHKKLNPEYEKKLDKIEKEDKRIVFNDISDFDRHFSTSSGQ